jgi:hypothetical protein
MAFKLSRDQLATRDALATVLRGKAETLNIAIAAFNRRVEPLSRAVGEALSDYTPTPWGPEEASCESVLPRL